jgi:hypothetical protein
MYEIKPWNERRMKATRIYEMGALAQVVHEKETVVHEMRVAIKGIRGQLVAARESSIGDGIMPLQGEYMLARRALRVARKENTNANRNLRVHKRVHGIRKVWTPEWDSTSETKLKYRSHWE